MSSTGNDTGGATLPPALYLVATPIGNAGDITQRALDTLKRVDTIACEDTRVTGPLMARFGISTPLTIYHDHNADRVRDGLLDRIANGASIALVSDAGTPLVSDPGFKLVREAVARGLAVTALPGASAVLAALSVSGLPTDRFMFVGFVPEKAGARRRTFEEIKGLRATLVFYESPRRLAECLAAMAEILGTERPVAVARELTKMFEEVRRGTLGELAEHYADNGPPKGEAVVVVGPPPDEAAEVSDEEFAVALAALPKNLGTREAADRLAATFHLHRRDAYQRVLALRGNRNDV